MYPISEKSGKAVVVRAVLLACGLVSGAAQAATVDKSSLTFADQKKATTSATQTLTVSNEGVITTNIVASISGTGFAIASNGCTNATLTAITPTCTLTVSFTPPDISANTYTGTVSITSSSNTTPRTVSLSGTSLPPVLSLSTNPPSNPVALSFGSQDVSTSSSAKSVTVSSTGANDVTGLTPGLSGDFARSTGQSGDCGSSLTSGSTCTINVIFTPTVAGNRTGTLSVASSASNTPTAALSGNGTTPSAPTPVLSPTSLSFGDQTSGTTSNAQTITLRNAGAAALSISSIALTGNFPGDFAQSNNCGTSLASAASCVITINFKPQAVRSSTATLSVSSNASNSPTTASLSGNGVVGVPIAKLSPEQLDFSVQKQSTASTTKSVTLTNSGTVPMSISSIGFSGTNAGDFSQTNTCVSPLAAASSCTISVTFTPAALNNRVASLVIATNASGSPHGVSLVGIGVADTKTVTVNGQSVNLSVSTGSNLQLSTAATPTTGLPSGLTYPVGFFNFSVTVPTGTSATFYFSLPSGTSANTYVKCVGTTCSQLASSQASADLRTVSFTITDGGTGDADGTANGTITDPGAPALNPTIVTASSLTSASDSSSGAMGWASLMLLGVPALLRARRRKLR